MTSGIDLGAAASFVGMAAPGGGGSFGTTGARTSFYQARGLGQRGGLRGSRLSDFISRFGGLGGALAEEGMRLDVPGSLMLSARMQASGAFPGTNAARGVQRMQGGAGGAYDSFASNFQGLGQAVLTAAAFRNASGPMDALRRLAEFKQNPTSAYEAISGFGASEQMKALIFSGFKFAPDEAEAMAAGLPGAGAIPIAGGAPPGGRFPLSSELAESDRARLEQVAGMNNQVLIEVVRESTEALLLISDKADPFLRAVVEVLRAINAKLP